MTCPTARAAAFKPGDRVTSTAGRLYRCHAKDVEFYRGRVGTILGNAEYGSADGFCKKSIHDLTNWFRVLWDGEQRYRLATAINLEHAS